MTTKWVRNQLFGSESCDPFFGAIPKLLGVEIPQTDRKNTMPGCPQCSMTPVISNDPSPQASDLSAGAFLTRFQRQTVLTAENVNKMLKHRYSQPGHDRISLGRTHQRAMLKPQIDFISRHVDFVVPIHWEYLTTPLLFRLLPSAEVKSNALEVALDNSSRAVQFR